MVTGDASGRNRQGTVNRSYWSIIKQELRLADKQMVIRSKNMDHRSSQIICNSALEHKNIKIDLRCQELINDIKYTSTDEHGKIVKTTQEGRHFSDGFRYLIDSQWPNILKLRK